jgi:Zn-dependent peptidase ImmA (M78 family)
VSAVPAEKGQAEREAQRVLQRLGVVEPPIPVERIAEFLGAELSYRPLEGDVSGLLYRDGDRAVIGVNALVARTRQRFTIAHEIGHFLLHKGHEVIVDKLVHVNLRSNATVPIASPEEEREANWFAAELLMPASLVRRLAREQVGRQVLVSAPDLVSTLASRFAVSPQAMEYRLVNLGLLGRLAIEG